MVEMDQINLKGDKESLELERNFKGQYKWVIKLKADVLGDVDLKKLEDIDQKLLDTYRGENENNEDN